MVIPTSQSSLKINTPSEKQLPNYQEKVILKIFDLFFELEFFIKVAISCTLIQQLIYWILNGIQLNLIGEVVLYWLVGSVSFYSIGIFIEKFIKKNESWRQ